MIDLQPREFAALVQKAIEGLPQPFAKLLDNLFVVVEEWPSPEDLEAVGMTEGERAQLFGLYHGVPLGERGWEYSALPDRVVLYRQPILRACQSREEAGREIRDTLVHELGHHFGLLDDDMPY